MRLIGLNERGNPVGEDHRRAVLTNTEIDLVRNLRDNDPDFWTYARLAEKFEVSKECIADICKCRRRTQTAVRFREQRAFS